MVQVAVIVVIVVVGLMILLGLGVGAYFIFFRKGGSSGGGGGGGGNRTIGTDSFAVIGQGTSGKPNYDLGKFIQTIYENGTSSLSFYDQTMNTILQGDPSALICNDSSVPKLNLADAKCLSFWADTFINNSGQTNDCSSVGSLFKTAVSTGACQVLG
jgi:hypothetical protein